ncbi:MAG TPA: hypothetical protein VMH86_16390 [Rhizomicrobium sp.]|nr:hypothetical protein [Rhizomicrobium sp.]
MRAFGAAFAGIFVLPATAMACACGCAVFDVGTSTLLPSGPGTTLFGEYDFLDQTKNWSGTHRAPAANNDDKEIKTDFFLAGVQHMFNDDWGVMAEIPYTDRAFTTDTGSGVPTFHHSALGDIRLMGVYSGFSPDMSSGIIFGVKLPTGDHTYANFDPDTEIGSGSTDLLLGGYTSGSFDATQKFTWFAQVLWQHHLATQNNYVPGSELNGAVGVSYSGWTLAQNVALTPVLQVLASERGRDGGAMGEPDDTGYQRLIVSPGLSLSVNQWKLYADVELPVYQHMNGNQLIAPYALKFIASYSL